MVVSSTENTTLAIPVEETTLDVTTPKLKLRRPPRKHEEDVRPNMAAWTLPCCLIKIWHKYKRKRWKPTWTLSMTKAAVLILHLRTYVMTVHP